MTGFLIDTFITLFVVVDPVGLAPLFIGLAHGTPAAQRRAMAIKGVSVAAVTLVLFLLVGEYLLRSLNISLAAMMISGGALLFLLSIDMIFARQSGFRSTTRREQQEAEMRQDISVFPLAIPLIAGPGAITSLLLVTSRYGEHPAYLLASVGVLAAVLLLALISLLLASRIVALIGETGANVIGRVLGILLAALAIQYILDGVQRALLAAA